MPMCCGLCCFATAILYATVVFVGLALIWVSLCYLYRYVRITICLYRYTAKIHMHVQLYVCRTIAKFAT